MKNFKHNQKGMTLAECVIAMALLGVMSAMLVSIAVAAKRQNRDNYLRAEEMYEQAAEIEAFNPDATYTAGDTKVSYLHSKAAGSTGNEFKLKADFTSYKLDTVTYGYQALPTNVDKNRKDYTLKALKSKYSSVAFVPSPGTGLYLLRLHNVAGQEVMPRLVLEEVNGGTLMNTDGNSLGSEFPVIIYDGMEQDVAFQAALNDSPNLITIKNNDSGATLGVITKSQLSNWTDDNGYIDIYLYADEDTALVALTKDDYEAIAE